MHEQMIQVFPSSRAVRDFYANMLENNSLLPKAMSISEFFTNALIVEDKIKADEDMRVLLMQKAADFKNFSHLKIQRDFFTFIKNSSYIFRFFEELSMEKVAIKSLKAADTYAQFDEHLEILEHLRKEYIKLLDEKGLYDSINLPECYELNEPYIKAQKGFLYHLEGFLNLFEFEVFCKIASLSSMHIHLHVNKYNQKMVKMFHEKGLDISSYGEYIIDLNSMCIVEKTPIKTQRLDATIRAFSTRALQCSFVSEQIEHFVKAGIAPQNIAVITPDEQIAPMLKRFDAVHNLNFAMGESFSRHDNYKRLEAIDKYFRLDEKEHHYRLLRLGIEPKLIEEIKAIWNKNLDKKSILAFIHLLCPEDKAHHLFEEELFRFSKLLERVEQLEFSKAFKLFLNRLSKLSIDDVMGGKITVMGLLESRGVAYKGVIVLDFSDEFVPKASQKDMFLNSSIRKYANLPDILDRQNLQRYFYYRLFEQAKKVSICYTQNDQSMASRFLDELTLPPAQAIDEKSYYKALFTSSIPKERYDPEVISLSVNLQDTPLSASKLKTLLTCKRAFYYKYILRSKEVEFPSDEIKEVHIGNFLHEALYEVYKKNGFESKTALMQKLQKYMQENTDNIVHRYHMDIWMHHLKSLCENEQKRYDEGYRVYMLEKDLHVKYKGFMIQGKIDRIDKKEESLSVLDYKSGKIPLLKSERSLEKTVDFQLEFYALLAGSLGDVTETGYYDLKSGAVLHEAFYDEKKQRLDEILESLCEPISEFQKSESLTPCGYCAYKALCNRSNV